MAGTISHALRGLLLAGLHTLAQAQDAISVLERRELSIPVAPPGTHRIDLTLVVLEGSGWAAEHVPPNVLDAVRILGQCGIGPGTAQLLRVRAPLPYLQFRSRESRELARALALPKPTVYFLHSSAQKVQFDAEAIGRGNSRTRPELADTVWVTRGARDLPIVIAHELAHVLMDSGEHSQEPGNLMREETAPGNARLSDAQCARMRDTATRNGLLQPQ